VDPFVTLFAESAGRVLVTVAPEQAEELLARAAAANLPAQRLGTVGGDVLAIEGVPALPLDELRTAWEGTLPALFGA
jgi:phosphoribosylformylglycinamidine synthase